MPTADGKANPVDEVSQYHVPLDGRHTTRSVRPSPSRSSRTTCLTAGGATVTAVATVWLSIDMVSDATPPACDGVNVSTALPPAVATVAWSIVPSVLAKLTGMPSGTVPPAPVKIPPELNVRSAV